jgi:hypothetical protein
MNEWRWREKAEYLWFRFFYARRGAPVTMFLCNLRLTRTCHKKNGLRSENNIHIEPTQENFFFVASRQKITYHYQFRETKNLTFHIRMNYGQQVSLPISWYERWKTYSRLKLICSLYVADCFFSPFYTIRYKVKVFESSMQQKVTGSNRQSRVWHYKK